MAHCSSSDLLTPELDGALTVDLEDWHSALWPTERRNLRESSVMDEHYVRRATSILLRELEDSNVRATFFVLGEVAQAVPELIKDISNKGHEIANHSPTHVPLWQISRSKLEPLIRRDTTLLESLTGRRPRGFRAPYFAIGRDDGWLLELLSREGYWYDSSVVPSWTPLYGIPSAPKSAYHPQISDLSKATSKRGILEIPITVWPPWPGLPGLPVGGGFFFRAWPEKFIIFALKRSLKPLVLYTHPGDLDLDKARTPGLSARDMAVQHLGSRRGFSSFQRVLREFRLGTISDVFGTSFDTATERNEE